MTYKVEVGAETRLDQLVERKLGELCHNLAKTMALVKTHLTANAKACGQHSYTVGKRVGAQDCSTKLAGLAQAQHRARKQHGTLW